jgi:hypothetical protein
VASTLSNASTLTARLLERVASNGDEINAEAIALSVWQVMAQMRAVD